MISSEKLAQSVVDHKTGEQLSQTVIKKKLRAIIYCRVSTDKQEQDGESLEYQEEKNLQYAQLHNHKVVAVLKEAKSGFIHYSLREKLTLARQMVRDGLADMIIVWDLRRFSRNFVHSALIFEEIEQAGGTIVSVSENIDNSLTGKLIRSILSWSAESERHKIIEYANRRWQSRIALNLPIGTGRAPYGWAWANKEKTEYILDPEEAVVRFSIFQMFVELDMSLREIAHKLTEDGIPSANKRRKVAGPESYWHPSTVRLFLMDPATIGTLVICKQKRILKDDGTKAREVHPERREIAGGIPAMVSPMMYERAQRKLSTNQQEQSKRNKNPEDFLLKGHVFCKTCGYKMSSRMLYSDPQHSYPFYMCVNRINKYKACPDLPTVRNYLLDAIVWEDCCRIFERLDLIQETLEHNIEEQLKNILEDTKGAEKLLELKQTIAHAEKQLPLYPKDSYTYNLISQDIAAKTEELKRYEQESSGSEVLTRSVKLYHQHVQEFLTFLNTMRGKYHEATFQEKRNALDVLGVKVFVSLEKQYLPTTCEKIEEPPQFPWISVSEVADILGMSQRTVYDYIHAGEIAAQKIGQSVIIHPDELRRYQRKQQGIEEETGIIPQVEWLSVSQVAARTGMSARTIYSYIENGELPAQQISKNFIVHPSILDQFRKKVVLKPGRTVENLRESIEITYSPSFTGVQNSVRLS